MPPNNERFFMKKVLLPFLLIITLIGCDSDQGVITTESGIRYTDDKVGEGSDVKDGSLVTIHFAGWAITDSTDLFGDWSKDSTRTVQSIGNSKSYNKPVKFILGSSGFIPGIENGMKGMKSGGIRTIIIPSKIIYGGAHQNPMSQQPDFKIVVELMEHKEVQLVKMWDVDTTNIRTTATGLKIVILEEGEGETAKIGNQVTVHYSGFLENGNKFDSSVEREEPIVFNLGHQMVIAGWDEGISLLKKGGKARLIIPPTLGYGETPRVNIPANSTLVFDVELLDIM